MLYNTVMLKRLFFAVLVIILVVFALVNLKLIFKKSIYTNQSISQNANSRKQETSSEIKLFSKCGTSSKISDCRLYL